MEKLLSSYFWFNSRPPHITNTSEYILIAFIIILAILGFVFFIKKRSQGKSKNFYITVWRKLYYFCLTNFIIGSFILFFDYEKVPFLSARFWYPLWLAGMATWLILIFKFSQKIPEKIKKAEKDEQYKKYLP